MSQDHEPIVLELAHLPREQMGPFMVLGLDKDASKEEIESHWADRVRWARKGQISISLEDINWAREKINDVKQRLIADATSLNLDTAEGLMGQLSRRYGLDATQQGPQWEPLDDEKPLADYNLAVEVPSLESVRAPLTVPEIPLELPAVAALVEQLTAGALDPWAVDW